MNPSVSERPRRASTANSAAARRAPRPPADTPVATPAATPAALAVGRVSAEAPTGFWIEAAGQRFVAQRATSCWLAVQVGDTVACLRAGPQAWVTAVLERQAPAGTPQVLDCPAPLIVRSPVELTLQAPNLRLHADCLGVRAEQATLAVTQAEVVGERLSVIGTTVKAIGSVWSTVFDRVLHHSRQHQRTTDGLDRVQATHLEHQATQVLQLHSEHTLINGEKLVKARGAQIHFG